MKNSPSQEPLKISQDIAAKNGTDIDGKASFNAIPSPRLIIPQTSTDKSSARLRACSTGVNGERIDFLSKLKMSTSTSPSSIQPPRLRMTSNDKELDSPGLSLSSVSSIISDDGERIDRIVKLIKTHKERHNSVSDGSRLSISKDRHSVVSNGGKSPVTSKEQYGFDFSDRKSPLPKECSGLDLHEKISPLAKECNELDFDEILSTLRNERQGIDARNILSSEGKSHSPKELQLSDSSRDILSTQKVRSIDTFASPKERQGLETFGGKAPLKQVQTKFPSNEDHIDSMSDTPKEELDIKGIDLDIEKERSQIVVGVKNDTDDIESTDKSNGIYIQHEKAEYNEEPRHSDGEGKTPRSRRHSMTDNSDITESMYSATNKKRSSFGDGGIPKSLGVISSDSLNCRWNFKKSYSSSKLTNPLGKLMDYVTRSRESLLDASKVSMNDEPLDDDDIMKASPTITVTESPPIATSGDAHRLKNIQTSLLDGVNEATNPNAIASALKITDRDPMQLGKDLFAGAVHNVTKSGISLIVGKGGEFYNTVLMSYLNCFDFNLKSLDEAFRYLCENLHLAGETQMVDRILYQFSRRYWDCNPSYRDVFRSIDIIYGILFSIVLLNTDLNVVNIGPNSGKKMVLKVFLKNTMDLVESMAQKNEEIRSLVADHHEIIKKWKKDLEGLLKTLYISVKNGPIMKHNQPETNQPAQNTALLTSTQKSVTRARSTSVTAFSTLISSASKALALKTNSTPMPNISGNNRIEAILLEGILIRKHHMEPELIKAKSRSWRKVWCVMRINSETSLELAMYRIHSKTSEKGFEEAEEVTEPYFSHNSSSPSNKLVQLQSDSSNAEKKRHAVFSSRRQPYKLSSHEPEVLSLIHAFTCFAQYGEKRSSVLLLHLCDGSSWLFQAPSSSSQESWVNSVNYYAGRHSKQPMRGGLSSNDYGWSHFKDKVSPGNEMNSPFMRRIEKREKNKLMVWTMPAMPTKLISNSPENVQLQLMRTQTECLIKEISEHDEHLDFINRYYDDSPNLAIAKVNWNKKRDYLKLELEKYQTYVTALTNSIPLLLLSQSIKLSPLKMAPSLDSKMMNIASGSSIAINEYESNLSYPSLRSAPISLQSLAGREKSEEH